MVEGSPTTAPEVSAPARPAIVPDWLVNGAALGWRVLAVAAMVGVLWLVASTLWVVSATIAVSVIVAAVLAPSVLRLRANGRSRTSAALTVWAIAMLVALAVIAILAIAFLPSAIELAQQLQAGLAAAQAQLAALGLPPAATTAVGDVVDAVRAAGGGIVGGIVASVGGVVTVLILSVFMVFFLLQDGDRGWVWALQALGEQKRERITGAGRDALVRVGGYLRGTTILAAAVAGTTFVFLVLLGVPLVVPLTILVFLAGYIPVFGGFVATVIVLLVTYASLGFGSVVILVLLIGIRNVVLSYFVRPSVYGRTVSIHPALVLIVLPAGYEIAGIIGLFAAVPITAVVLAAASAVIAVVEPDPRPPLPGIVPAWLDRIAQWSWRILVAVVLVVLVVMAMVAMPLVFTPLILALVLAATLDPLVTSLVRRGWSRGRAVLAAVGGGTLIVAAVLAVTVVVLLDQVGSVSDRATQGAQSVNDSSGGQLELAVDGVTRGLLSMVQTITAVAQTAAAVGVVILLSLLLTFYFLRDGGRLWARLVTHVPSDDRSQLDGAGSRAFTVLSGYMIGTAAISFVGAASQFVIMIVLGIPLALPVAVLSFILCFIPYIGGFISTGIAFLLTVATGTPADVLIMAIWTIVFNIVQGNIVSPLVYGRTVHIHPAVVLLAIPAAAAVAGIMGMFVVVPAIGVVAATWRPIVAMLGARATRSAAEADALDARAFGADVVGAASVPGTGA